MRTVLNFLGRSRRLILQALCCGLFPLAGLALDTTFLSIFSGSAVNPASYADPTGNDAGWVVGATKAHGLGAIGDTGFSLDMASTSAAFVEAAARIINIPVALTEPGDTIRLVVNFTAAAGILQGSTNSQLGVGLFASGGSNPPSGVNGQIRFDLADMTSGYLQDWTGYALLFENAGGSNRLNLRPAQAAASINSAQELLFPGNTGAFTNAVSLQSGSFPGTTLANGTLCTLVYTIILVNSTTLSLQACLYEGPDSSGVLLASVSGTAAGASVVTTRFDAVGLGYIRKGVAGDSRIVFHRLEVLTNKPTTPARVVAGPDNLNIALGGSGSLSVTVSGAAPITYTWYKDGELLAGQDGASILFTDAGSAMEGVYHVVVENQFGSDTSSGAAVTVSAGVTAPVVTTQPAGATRVAGEGHTFSVAVAGTAPFTFDWRKDNQSLGAPSQSTLTLSGLTRGDAGSYTVAVSNSAGQVESEPALLEVWTKPVILAHPESVMADPGVAAALTVVAEGYPEPGYKWYRNGLLIAGESGSTLSFASLSAADVGTYHADAVNGAGITRSASAAVNVISALALVSPFPSASTTGLPPDIQVPLQFDQPVQPGITGRIRVYAGDGTLVDTLDMGLGAHNKVVGGLSYRYDPVLTEGATAWLVPRTGALAYGKTYYILIDPGAILDAHGGSFAGVAEPATIRFSTRATPPAANAAFLRVKGDGSADYATIQGAIDHVPAGNSQPVTIRVEPGTYRELLHIPSSKPFLTLQGSAGGAVVVSYLNNANRNPGNQRASFYSRASDLVLDSLSFVNTTPKGGSQAETLNTDGNRVVVRDCAFRSLQDTLKLSGGGVYFLSCYIEGDVDFLWDDADAFLEDCVIHSANKGYLVQTRNGQDDRGFVFVRCRLTGDSDAGGTYLGRIDPNVFPYSEAAFIDCAMGPHIAAAGWLLNNADSAPQVRFLESGSTDLDGNLLDLSGRHPDSTILDAAGAAPYRNPQWVTGFNTATPAWVAALRDRDPLGWSFDGSLGWNWGYRFARGNAGFFLWTYAFSNWIYAYPVAADSVYFYAYGSRAGWYWSSRAYGQWVWDYTAGSWLALGG